MEWWHGRDALVATPVIKRKRIEPLVATQVMPEYIDPVDPWYPHPLWMGYTNGTMKARREDR